ncbi:MAG TPA: YggS family pyridoxal phosphate-dependent enzyme, partial [Methylomirabilota bacterium]|nr:YggS family pyridoxal phosphate-dependent enzyme [Methylomirabilota bacterium]
MDIAERFRVIRERLQAACARAGRDPASVTLMAVSKGQSADAIREAADAGQTLFGESKVQEARHKIPQCPDRLRWQMIGHLQSNKCRDAVHLFEMIQSVDSLPLAQEIDKWAAKQGKTMPVLLEINVAGEASKFGYPPERMLTELEAINALPRLELRGLMAVPPFVLDPERARPWFRKLRELRDRAQDRLGAPLPELSMGMSGDFEVAIEEGATLVRLG